MPVLINGMHLLMICAKMTSVRKVWGFYVDHPLILLFISGIAHNRGY